MRSAVFAALSLVVLLPPTYVRAQFWDKLTNPKITVPVSHPPSLGLQINRVAFGPTDGEAGEEFVASLTARFADAGVEVIERRKLDLLLAEQDFGITDRVDVASAVAMGKILGPAVLIFAEIPRYQVRKTPLYQDWKDNKGFVHRTYISRTQAFAKGRIRAVDLATGRIFKATTIEASPEIENKINDRCCAEFPSEFDLQDLAMNQLVEQAHRLFLPWTEMTAVYFFDDKDCNLKIAHQFMKAGNVDGALQQSLANLEACKAEPKVKDKTLAHAYHNVGVAYFATGEFDLALENLNAAQGIKAADIHTEAIGECMRAKALADEVRQVEDQMALGEGLGSRGPAKTPAVSEGKPTTPEKTPVASRTAPQMAPASKVATKTKGAKPAGSLEERLEKLNTLLKKGLITQKDYDTKKAALLNEL
jgi:tetratricopeptide (TPR) repeat protein